MYEFPITQPLIFDNAFKDIKTAFSGYDAPQWAFIGDIRKCFENISHEWILQRIPMAEGVLWKFLNAGYIFAGELYPTDIGIGIGCMLSPIIANMVLNGLQAHVYKRLYPNGDIDYTDGNMIRYADDLIFSARSEEFAKKIQRYVSEFLEERGLELSAEKRKVIHISEGFTFLLRAFAKRGAQLYAEPSKKAIERFMAAMKETISCHSGSQKSLIDRVNKK